MKTRDFFFELPQELIAQTPPPERGQSRLLVYNRVADSIIHTRVTELANFIDPGTMMVFNNTKVRKARLYAESSTGGRFETLLLEQDPQDKSVWQCMVRKAARLKLGHKLQYPKGVTGEVIACEAEYRRIRFQPIIDDNWLDLHGHIPLPPYIKRADQAVDAQRYQTIYAGPNGSVAAPTAGLHFTPEILAKIDARGVLRQSLTLHVGLGTFLPVRSENIADHHMHSEHFNVSAELAAAVQLARSHGQPILAVGTTSLRTLESAANPVDTQIETQPNKASLGWTVHAGSGKTDIFITPGYQFRCVDQLFTNFHTPESTLLMLVSAFAGMDQIRRVYAEAIRERYRFFSYGDAMLIQ